MVWNYTTFSPSVVTFLDKFLIMPALVGQVTGLDSHSLILLVGLTFLQEDILHLLQKYSHTFSVNEYDLGLTHFVEHTVDTGDASPVKQPPSRVPIAFVKGLLLPQYQGNLESWAGERHPLW
jgi:hypothetical protein